MDKKKGLVSNSKKWIENYIHIYDNTNKLKLYENSIHVIYM